MASSIECINVNMESGVSKHQVSVNLKYSEYLSGPFL